MSLRVEGEAPASRIEMSMFANTGKNIEHLSPRRGRVLHAIRSEKREPEGPRQVNQLFVMPIFATHQMPLNFDEHVIAAISVNQTVQAISRLSGTREERNQSFGKFGQLLPLHRALSLFTPQMRLRQQLA